jgi:hypothetical protein
MLILGTVMQLGGGQSALAESIGRLKVMITVSEGLYRATSMDCTVMKPGAERESIQYRVRWSGADITRVDMGTNNGTGQTMWISKGTVSVVDREGGAVRSTAVATIPSPWQLPMEFLSPTILARHMEERYGLMRAERQNGPGPNEFLLVGQEGPQVVEIALDVRTYLPTTLKRYPSRSAWTVKEPCLEEVRFQWNQPIPRELLVPGSSAVKRRVN